MTDHNTFTVPDSGTWLGSQLETLHESAGLDGADRPEWHTPGRDINARTLLAIGALTAALLFAGALVYVGLVGVGR